MFDVGRHVETYRQSNGEQGGFVRGMPILLLTTTGRKSGLERTVPVMYITDGPNYVVIASNNGAEQFPAWYWNLQSDPNVTVQVKDQIFSALAEQVNLETDQRLWGELILAAPFFDDYRKGTERDIPMIILKPQS